MKEVKMNSEYFTLGGPKVRVIDVCEFNGGVRGIVFVPAEVSDAQLDAGKVTSVTLEEEKFKQTFLPAVIEAGDEVMGFCMGKCMGVEIAQETADPNVLCLPMFDNTLVRKEVHESGLLIPVFLPASQQAREFTVSAMEKKEVEVAAVINQMIAGAQEYIEFLSSHKPLMTADVAKLKEVATAQRRRLQRTIDQFVEA